MVEYTEKNTLGAPVKRVEDPSFLRGDAKFTADLNIPGMLHMAILRSGRPHALIESIDLSDALKSPGVVRIVTSADLDGKMMPLPCIWIPGGAESHFPKHPFGVPGAGPVLAKGKVRYVGDAVAAVVAETREQAYAALDRIKVDYKDLPAVVSPREALEAGSPKLHDDVPNNLNALCTYGNKENTERAIAAAEVLVELETYNQRTINSPMEPRASVGQFDSSTGEYTLWATSQSPHNHRLLLSLLVLGIPFNKLRIIAPHLGGSFGTKGYLYADMPLVLWLAKELGRAVKWVDTRTDLMRSTVHGRDQQMKGVLAGDKAGKISGLKVISYANLGAYPSTIGPGVATAMVGRCVTSVYDIAAAYAEVHAVFTNIVPLGAQRGSGRAEATFLLERLIDQYARRINMDPAEVRLKNMITAERQPFDNRMGWIYDSGDYVAAFRKVLEMADYKGLVGLKSGARKRGKLLGMGFAPFVAVSGVGPSPRMFKEGMLGGTWESANIKVHPTGELSVAIGSTSQGQGHETSFAQIVADELGVPLAMIEVLHSDTKRAPYGQGSYGSRSFSVGGAAVLKAAKMVKQKVKTLAAHIFKVPVEQVTYEDGKLFPSDQPDKAQTLQQIALAMWYGWDLPEGMEPNLDIYTVFDPPYFNFPYGCHVAVVEIEETTGQVDLVRFFGVHDAGTIGNSMIFEGQIHGGIVHGAGQALWEAAQFSPEGQLLTSNLTEYALPRATNIGAFELSTMIHPTPHTDLGAKGAGELGTVGSPAAIANAVCDALSSFGVTHIEMPLTSEKVWRAMNGK